MTRDMPKLMIIGGPDVDARLELIRHLKPNFDVHVLGSEPALAAAFQGAGVGYRVYPLQRRANPLADWGTVRELTRILREEQPDIVHTFDTKPGIWGCLAARRARTPVILTTITGLGSLYVQRGMTTRLLRGAYETLQRVMCRVADITVFQNRADADEFVSRRIVPATKRTIIPGSGVTTGTFDPLAVAGSERDRFRTELGIPRDALVVTMIARLIRSKGVLEFMHAARLVASDRSGVAFLLVGAPDEESSDRLSPEEIQELRRSVVWPGPRRDIRTVLAASDVFTLPSTYREGIPRVLLEAAAMALPLISTDTPGCNDVVVEGLNGTLIPVHDPAALARAVGRLVEEPALRREFGDCSRRRAVERFDIAVVARQTRSLYHQLLSRKRPAIRFGCYHDAETPA